MNRRTLLKGGIVAAIVGVVGATGFAVREGDLWRTPEATGGSVQTDTVTIPDEWVFRPEVIEVPQGTTITWINRGAHPHTVTFRDDEPIEFHAVLEPGERAEHTFTRTGTFDYYCRFHLPDMVGKVTVVPSG